MTNTQRKVQDMVSDPAGVRDYAVDAATEIEIGDLLWLDTDDVKPMSATGVWTGSLAGSRGKAAEKFVGVAQSAHRANVDPAGTVRVAARGQYRFPLGTSVTLEVGDLVTVVQDGSSSFFQDQVVDKMVDSPANQGMAIGRVTTRETVASAVVNFEIMARGIAGGGTKAFLTS